MLSPAGIEEQAEFMATVPWFRRDVGTLDADDFEAWLTGAVDYCIVSTTDLDAVASTSALLRRAWELCRGGR